MTSRNSWLPIIILVATAAALVWVGLFPSRPPEPPEVKRVAVGLAWLHQAQFAGMYMAKEEGLYADAGLEVDLQEYRFGDDTGKLLVDREIDFAVMSATEVLDCRRRGKPVVAVAAIYQVSPYAFASLEESGISTPADWRGKTLGNEGENLQAVLTYRALLDRYGVPKGEVRYVNLDFDEVEDLRQRRADVIDLYRTDQPYLFDQAGLKYRLLFPEQFGFGMYGDLIVAREDMVENRPETVAAFVNATLDGWEMALRDHDQAIVQTMKYASEAYADEEYEKYILSSSAPLIRPSGGEKIGSMSAAAWESAYREFENAGLIQVPFDWREAYTVEFIGTDL
jgi:ABC-type nitrate/sulfonate/bicarbonate transport system substrate-binding protein